MRLNITNRHLYEIVCVLRLQPMIMQQLKNADPATPLALDTGILTDTTRLMTATLSEKIANIGELRKLMPTLQVAEMISRIFSFSDHLSEFLGSVVSLVDAFNKREDLAVQHATLNLDPNNFFGDRQPIVDDILKLPLADMVPEMIRLYKQRKCGQLPWRTAYVAEIALSAAAKDNDDYTAAAAAAPPAGVSFAEVQHVYHVVNKASLRLKALLDDTAYQDKWLRVYVSSADSLKKAFDVFSKIVSPMRDILRHRINGDNELVIEGKARSTEFISAMLFNNSTCPDVLRSCLACVFDGATKAWSYIVSPPVTLAEKLPVQDSTRGVQSCGLFSAATPPRVEPLGTKGNDDAADSTAAPAGKTV